METFAEKGQGVGPVEEDLVGALEAATIAGVHHRTIIAWIHNGWLPAMKRPGSRGKYQIKRQDLLGLINRPYQPRKRKDV